MKTLVVGDLHGKWEVVEKVLATDYNVVFVGDYLDSHDRTSKDCIKTLKLVLDATEEIDRHTSVVALRGNHEQSYIGLENRCSGYSTTTASMLKGQWWSLLLDHVWVDGFLISHAGVSNSLLESTGITLEDYLANKTHDEAGYARGGPVPIGGLLWCDWFDEFEPIPDVPQIVGHSGYRPRGFPPGVLQNGNSYNVDCLDRVEEFLLIDNGKAEIITL